MPSALRYVPPDDKWRTNLTPSIINEKTARHRLYRRALKYYRGEHTKQLLFNPDTEPDDNVVINLVKTTADRTASFLFPEAPVFEIDPENPDETPEEAFIHGFIKANGGVAFLTKMAIRGFLSGHCFLRVKPPRAWEKYPKLILLDPLAITVWWRADDVGDILWYEHRYVVGDVVYVKDYVFDPENRCWRIYTYRQKTDAEVSPIPQESSIIGIPGPHGGGFGVEGFISGLFDQSYKFELVRNGNRDFALHTSLLPPIVEWAHLPDPDNYYGQSEAGNLDLQDTINRIWSEINRIVREHSDVLDVLIGADVDSVHPFSDGLMVVDASGAKVQRLEFKGDLDAAVNTVNKLVETYLSIVRVVILKGDFKDLQRVTNAAVRTLFVDALAKNAQLQSSYGSGLEKIARLALLMSGDASLASKAESIDIKVKFHNPLPVDQTEISNINALAINAGYRSLRTAATELGDDWVFERAAIETEAEMKIKRELKRREALGEANGDDEPKPGTNPQAGIPPVGA